MSRPINEDRQAALRYGLHTYTGAPHSKCGTTERYAAGGGCVYCARLLASEQREALKYRKAQEAQALDNPLPTELEPDNAAERLRHSIDDMM